MGSSEVLIVGAVRTPVGKIFGGLQTIRPDDLAAHALTALVERTGVPVEEIDEVFFGCANQAGEDNRNIARMAAVLAGFPYSVPGVTVNRLCASGLEAVNQAARAIRVGDMDLAIAGGVESMSRAPWVMGKPVGKKPIGNPATFDTCLGWRFPNPKMEERFPLQAMGITAENLVDKYGISREDQDAFAVASHHRAAAAWEAGRYDAEVVPVSIPQRKGDPIQIARDEGIRPTTSVEALARLKPAFRKGGSVTAGNSSSLNDGSAALLLASEAKCKEHGWKPLAVYRGCASAGVDPTIMGIGPVPATRKVTKRLGLNPTDFDVVELNEAFAAQSLSVIRELELDEARVNPNGGAIAIGHPLGCSGARILTGLIHEMNRRQAQRGLATLCVGVGQGVSTVVELP